MVWFVLLYLYSINRDLISKNKRIRVISTYIIPIYATVFTIIHVIYKTLTAFQIHFGSFIFLLLTCLYQRYHNSDLGIEGTRIISIYILTNILAFCSWLIDYHYCNMFIKYNIYPIGHAIWHILIAYTSFYSVAMLKYLEYTHSGIEVYVKYRFGLPLLSPFRALGTDHNSDLLTANNKDLEAC